MSLLPQEQFKKFLENSKEVLILIPENPDCDAVGSAYGLSFFLERIGIDPTIASSGEIPEKFSFLPRPQKIIHDISGSRDFVLSFNTKDNKITGIRKEQNGDTLNIYLTPEKGSLNPKDFSFILAKFKYDLIIAIDCPDLEKLGPIYLNNPDLFFEIPIVNIDSSSSNESFGQTNLVDVTACSSSEIIKRSMEEINKDAIDKNIATCLLAGIICATDSFQKKNTTPKCLSAAADLMEKGAEQQEIIRWLYKTQPLHILKLMGRLMSKINWEEEAKIVWAPLSIEDFVQSRSNPDVLPEILDKLKENYSEGRIFIVTYSNNPSETTAIIRMAEPDKLGALQQILGGKTSQGILEIKLDIPDTYSAGKFIAEKIKGAL